MRVLHPGELVDALSAARLDGPQSAEDRLIVVDLDARPLGDTRAAAYLVAGFDGVSVAITTGALTRPRARLAAAFDVVLGPGQHGDAERIAAAVDRTPLAATTLVRVLRTSEHLAVTAALLVESWAYSTLLFGPEFKAWRAGRPPRDRPASGPDAVAVARDGDELHIRLQRPDVRNALDQPMRQALAGALDVAVADPTIGRVVLTGEGAGFCAGGDLEEFGSAPDPATAHAVRVGPSPPRLLAALGARAEARVHGTSVGAGVEMVAFAGRVVATPDATFSLPEVSMGLIPGAGGTVSLPRRIGRQRTAWLGLTGDPIDATRALEWGLVDEVCTPDRN